MFKCVDPICRLEGQLKWSQKFVDTARSMILESTLTLEYKDGAYRTALCISYDRDSDDEILGYRTFGSIFGNDFLLDCDLVHERMVRMKSKEIEETGKMNGEYPPSKKEYFNELLRLEILSFCPQPSQYLWFRKHEEFYEQEKHKFYCISNDILMIDFGEFSHVIHIL